LTPSFYMVHQVSFFLSFFILQLVFRLCRRRGISLPPPCCCSLNYLSSAPLDRGGRKPELSRSSAHPKADFVPFPGFTPPRPPTTPPTSRESTKSLRRADCLYCNLKQALLPFPLFGLLIQPQRRVAAPTSSFEDETGAAPQGPQNHSYPSRSLAK